MTVASKKIVTVVAGKLLLYATIPYQKLILVLKVLIFGGVSLTLNGKGFKVNISKDNTFKIESVSYVQYDNVMVPNGFLCSDSYETLSVVIDNYVNERRIAIILSQSFADYEIAILSGYDLIMLVNTELLIIDCQTLELKIQKELPEGFYFSIHNYDDGYLIYGELDIIKVSSAPYYDVEWMFSGADIFVTQDNTSPFCVKGAYVYLKDWNGQEYIVDRNGKEL